MAGPARKADPWLTERMRNDTVLLRHEQSIVQAVLRVMQEWLTATRTLVLGGSLTASGEDVDAARGAFEIWRTGLETDIEPAIGEAFGAGFNAGLRTADISVLPYQERHIDTVHSRLRMWPEGAFEDMRPELVQAITLGESMGDTTTRVAGILDINAPTRRLRAKITEADSALAADDLTPARRRDLRALRRRLWEEHDASLGEWQYLARRIARTEVQSAVESGKYAAAQAEEATTGEELWLQWLSASDSRTRRSHRVADGQMVRVGTKFRVGGALLDHPCDPKGPAREIIACRCTSLVRDRSEVDDQLRSVHARGVAPRSARLGPDPAEQAELAEQLVAAEDRGEVVEWPAPVETLPTPQPVRVKREFAGRRLDDLADEMTRFAEEAGDDADWDYFDRLTAEVDRREVVNAANRARRQAAKESRQEAQGLEYERLLAQGVDDEDAIEQAYGVSVADQRRQNALSYLRGMGYQGKGLDELIRAWYRDEVYRAWREAEDYTRGHMLARSAEGKVTNWADLWTMNESTARKYASEELRNYWDANGRITFAELKARLLGDSAEVNDITARARDFVQ